MLDTGTRSRWFTLSLFVVLSLSLFAFHQIGWLRPVERLAAAPLATVQSWLATNLRDFNEFVTTVQTLGTLRTRVTELELENDRLTVENQSLHEELVRASLFEKLLHYTRDNRSYDYLTADVIGRDTDINQFSLRLNRGTDQGVDIGMPVVTERGLVGRVVEVGPNWAQIQLIIDRTSAVRARLGQSRADGLAAGQGTNGLLMDFISQDHAISVGEIVLTSGMGGTFPAGLVIGQVTNVRQSDEALFQQADVHPSVNFTQLEIVLIITNFDRPPDQAPGPGGPHR